MSNYSTIDRESLQKVLTSAFAVQQSQKDSQSLSAIVEAGRLVMHGELDVDEAMHLTVDRTRQVANTAGVTVDALGGVQLSLPGLEDDRSSGLLLSHSAITGSAHGAGAVADIALDLVLTDIAEQARLATKAGAAAIALMRGEEMVCRATTRESPSELGVVLNVRAGFCGDCMQTRKVQCCTDTDADSRVDAVACRRLGIRSFVIFPVLNQEELVGLIEIFSLRPKAFGDEDIQTLHALSQQILINVSCAVEFATPLPEDEPPAAADSMELDSVHFGQTDQGMPQDKHPGLRDLQTTLLVSLLIVLALLLGWMLGRVSWRGTEHKKGPPALVSAKPDAASPKLAEPKQTEASPPPPVSPNATSSEMPSDNLAVYQDGRVIFRLKPPQARGEPSAADPAPGSPGKARARLLQRIKPEYPEAAKQQHIQGPVVLEARVGSDGAVQQLAVISGNSMLSTAASDAVLKWRFKPLVQNGRAVPFQIRVRLDFVLP
jgi:TonB family protein